MPQSHRMRSYRRRRCVTLLASVPAHRSNRAQRLTYPETKKVDQVDDFFGTKVADPYRWMEDLNSPERRRVGEAGERRHRAVLLAARHARALQESHHRAVELSEGLAALPCRRALVLRAQHRTAATERRSTAVPSLGGPPKLVHRSEHALGGRIDRARRFLAVARREAISRTASRKAARTGERFSCASSSRESSSPIRCAGSRAAA